MVRGEAPRIRAPLAPQPGGVVQKPEISAGPRAVGFVPSLFVQAGGAGPDELPAAADGLQKLSLLRRSPPAAGFGCEGWTADSSDSPMGLFQRFCRAAGRWELTAESRNSPMALFRRFLLRRRGKWQRSGYLAYVSCADGQMALFRGFPPVGLSGTPTSWTTPTPLGQASLWAGPRRWTRWVCSVTFC